MNNEVEIIDDFEIIDDIDVVETPVVPSAPSIAPEPVSYTPEPEMPVASFEVPQVTPVVAQPVEIPVMPTVEPTSVEPAAFAYNFDATPATDLSSAPDPISAFNEEPVQTPSYSAPEPVLNPVQTETPSINVPEVDQEQFSDTLLLNKNEIINPELGIEKTQEEVTDKDDEKSNKKGIAFIVILFILLIGFIIALPYITGTVK